MALDRVLNVCKIEIVYTRPNAGAIEPRVPIGEYDPARDLRTLTLPRKTTESTGYSCPCSRKAYLSKSRNRSLPMAAADPLQDLPLCRRAHSHLGAGAAYTAGQMDGGSKQ